MGIDNFDIIVIGSINLFLQSVDFMTNTDEVTLVSVFIISGLPSSTSKCFALFEHVRVKLWRADVQVNICVSLHKKRRKKPLGLFIHVARVVDIDQPFVWH